MFCNNCGTTVDSADIVKCTNKSCNSVMHKDCASTCRICGEYICDDCMLNDDICEQCSLKTRNKISVIRRSHLETYQKCPYMFYLEVVKHSETPENIYSRSGIDLHELFDEYSIRDDGTVDELYDKFVNDYESKYDKGFYKTQEFKNKMHDRYKQNIEGFLDLRSRIPKPTIREKKIIFSIGDNLPSISITMDRIHEENGGLVIGDYKTGKVIVGQNIIKNLQVPSYIYAIQQEYGKRVERFELYYLGESKQRTYVRVNDDVYECKVGNRTYTLVISDALKEIRNILENISREEFSIDPYMKAYNCTMCPFCGTLCAGADEQIWINSKEGA